jgi:hypothetical protein
MRIKVLWTVFWILVWLFDHERRLISPIFGTWVALALLYFDDALHGLRGVPGYGSMYNDIYCIKVAKRCMEAGGVFGQGWRNSVRGRYPESALEAIVDNTTYK